MSRLNMLKAFAIGVKDGFAQPHTLNWSTNVEHLWDSLGEDDAMDWQDKGINVGQFLRAGFKSEAWERGFWPFGRGAL